MATVSRYATKIVASLAGVKTARRDAAKDIAARARATLTEHRATGTARIEVKHGTRDSLVSLVDDAALSIEFGRGGYTTDDGREVGPMEGLHILGREL